MADPVPSRGSESWFRMVLVDAVDDHKLVGLTDDELAEVRSVHERPLPVEYESFLRVAGRNAGPLWVGSDMLYPSILESVPACADIAAESNPVFAIPAGSTLLGHHQGYEFDYLDSAGAVFRFREGTQDSTQVAESFPDYIHGEIQHVASTQARTIAAGRALIVQIFGIVLRLSDEADVAPPGPDLVEAVSDLSEGTNTTLPTIVNATAPRDSTERLVHFYKRLQTEAKRLGTTLAAREG